MSTGQGNFDRRIQTQRDGGDNPQASSSSTMPHDASRVPPERRTGIGGHYGEGSSMTPAINRATEMSRQIMNELKANPNIGGMVGSMETFLERTTLGNPRYQQEVNAQITDRMAQHAEHKNMFLVDNFSKYTFNNLKANRDPIGLRIAMHNIAGFNNFDSFMDTINRYKGLGLSRGRAEQPLDDATTAIHQLRSCVESVSSADSKANLPSLQAITDAMNEFRRLDNLYD